MASNLNSARSLIQADLDHARNVLELWTHQVSELEKTLEQINAVGTSRDALRVPYQGSAARAPALGSPVASNEKPKRGSKPKTVDGSSPAKSAATTNDFTAKRNQKASQKNTATPGQGSKAVASKGNTNGDGKPGRVTPAAKYKDPNSDKTWSGRGRRPAWFAGDSTQYEIRVPGRKKAADTNTASEPQPSAVSSTAA